MMNRQTIRELALTAGFTLQEQPGNVQDLNPYVYDFAEKLIRQTHANVLSDSWEDFGNKLLNRIEETNGLAEDGRLFRLWISLASSNPVLVAKGLAHCLSPDDYRNALIQIRDDLSKQ